MSAAELLPLGHQIYPAKYFTASPTYNTWVKITAADILALRHETGFEGGSRRRRDTLMKMRSC